MVRSQHRWSLALGSALLLGLAGSASAQSTGRPTAGGGRDSVPASFRPPPGMCRVWLDNVPPGQQPAPTSCAEAVRNLPSNARVVFGDGGARPVQVKKMREQTAEASCDSAPALPGARFRGSRCGESSEGVLPTRLPSIRSKKKKP